MIYKKLYTGIVFFLISFCCLAQTDSIIAVTKTSSDLRISYNSSLIYPGARLGIDFPVNSVHLTKNHDSENPKLIIKDRFVSAGAGWYHHVNFHDNIYATLEWTMRRTHKKGFFSEFSSGLGYSWTRFAATTYRVNNKGDVSILKAAGYNYALLIAGGGFGFDFSKKGIPLSIFYKADILAMLPYNSTVYLRPVMELGIIYKPSEFIRILKKTRTLTK